MKEKMLPPCPKEDISGPEQRAAVNGKPAVIELRAFKSCPVCGAGSPLPFLSMEGRDYFRCSTCGARLLHPAQYPSREEEHANYILHKNDPHDPGYRRFLSKLAQPLLQRLPAGAEGLDYGCGPGPALAAMLQEAGHHVALYDPFFHPDPAPLGRQYDFVTCTETIEHFHNPAGEFGRLVSLVRPGGWLALMTCFQTEDTLFRDWHYRKDATHVVFYREETMHYLAAHYGWSCDIPVKDVALMQRPQTDARGPAQ